MPISIQRKIVRRRGKVRIDDEEFAEESAVVCGTREQGSTNGAVHRGTGIASEGQLGNAVKHAAAIVVLAVAMAALSAPAAQRQPGREDHDAGVFMYRAFCASCHGETGKGDGPVADLGPPPPDLTQLRAANGGVFPRDDVRATLQGTRRVSGHETTEMPNWRDVLRRTERADDRTIAARIEALVAHLESLQR
jgi:mono/diheme cytochrome c family protein